MYHDPVLPDAVAYITGGSGANSINGQVRFYQEPNSVLVAADVTGLPENPSGFFGFHIHQGSGCAGRSFSDTGSHYDPDTVPHPRHAGDLPPLLMQHGRAHMTVRTDRFRVADIIGRTVVIHNGPDDFHTQPSGNAGEKIACGVVVQL